jgi:hypothetical protein
VVGDRRRALGIARHRAAHLAVQLLARERGVRGRAAILRELGAHAGREPAHARERIVGDPVETREPRAVDAIRGDPTLPRDLRDRIGALAQDRVLAQSQLEVGELLVLAREREVRASSASCCSS